MLQPHGALTVRACMEGDVPRLAQIFREAVSLI